MKVDLEALEEANARVARIIPRELVAAIIAELRAGRALVNDLEGATVSTIEAEASRVLVRGALREFRKATKGDG